MLFRKKQRAWYWSVLVIFIVIRFIYGIARFFMNSVDKHAARQDVGAKSPKKKRF